MIKLLSIISIILAIILFPPAALALVSNNAVPGDLTYPIKRSLEDRIYAIASLNPTSKAWFSAARSDRRFKEIKLLVTSGKQAKTTLVELVSQADVTVEQMKQVTDKTQRKQLLNDYVQTLNKYEENLKQLSSEAASNQAPSVTPTTFPTSIPVTTSQPATSAQPTSTPTPTSTPAPTPLQSPVVSSQPPSTSPGDLDDAAEALRKLKEKAKKATLSSVETLSLPTPTPTSMPSLSSDNTNTPTPTKKTGTTFRLFSVSSPVPTPELSAIASPTPPEISPSSTPAACSSPAIPAELKYDANTKTVSWNVAVNASYYNIRLVNPERTQFNFDNDTNTWYTFPDNAISSSGSYSWWVDAANDCGTSRADSTFSLP